jgi:quercetin dioxygenase-like cupin family protein
MAGAAPRAYAAAAQILRLFPARRQRRATDRGGSSMIDTMRSKRFGFSRAGLFGPLAGLLFLASAASAQDVVQVAGDSHKVLLENAQVRVLAVTIKPGEKVPMHSHPANVSYVLTDGKLRITMPDGKSVEREPKAGTASWSEPVTHAFENIGTTEYRQVQIELKNAGPAK